MGILRYVVQGFGWEVGRQAAKESIDALAQQQNDEATAAPPPTKRDLKKLEAARKKEEARKKAEIEAELRRLKKQR